MPAQLGTQQRRKQNLEEDLAAMLGSLRLRWGRWMQTQVLSAERQPLRGWAVHAPKPKKVQEMRTAKWMGSWLRSRGTTRVRSCRQRCWPWLWRPTGAPLVRRALHLSATHVKRHQKVSVARLYLPGIWFLDAPHAQGMLDCGAGALGGLGRVLTEQHPRRCTAAAAIERRRELLLLTVDSAAGSLAVTQELALPGVAGATAVAFDCDGRLWVAAGVAAEGVRCGALKLRVAVRDSHGVRCPRCCLPAHPRGPGQLPAMLGRASSSC